MPPGVHTLDETAESLLAYFAVATAHDRSVKRKRRILGWLAVACFPVAIFFIVNSNLDDVVRAAAIFGGLALATLFIVRWRAYRRQGLDERKLAAALRLLRVLRADIPRNERVRLVIDPRPYTASEPVSARGTVSKYRHGWLSLSVRLADGNTLRLAVVDRVRRKRKRRAVVERGLSSIALSLRLAKRYQPAGAIAEGLRDRRRLGGFTVVRRQLVTSDRGSVLHVALRTADAPAAPMVLADGDAVLRALRWTYGAIAAARRAA